MDATQTRGAVEALYATAHWLHSQDRARDAACVFRAMVCVAPTDERGWLGLGASHEALEQPEVALEMYATGAAVARAARCEVARSRLFRSMGQRRDALEALESAQELLQEDGAELGALIAREREVCHG
jgi:tetratricopeptide (TPR) repeat protein